MELVALDSNFAPLMFFKYIELQWNRKFYDIGDFSVQIPANEYNPRAKFVWLKGRPELGLIQKVEYSESSSGSFVQLSGFFAEKLLDEKIVWPTYSGQNQSITGFFDSIWNSYIQSSDLQNEYKLQKKQNSLSQTDKISKMATGDSVASMLIEALKPLQVSLQASFDNINDKIIFQLITGRDLTQDNTAGNNFVVFSEYFGNLQGATYLEDNSCYKNYAVVQGEGEGSDRVTVYVDLSAGKTKRMLYVDARDIRQEDGITLAQYQAQLRQRGIEKLANNVDITNLETDIIANAGFTYYVDYDLGDTVDISVNQIQKSFKSQIIEASEVFNGAGHNVTLTFGDNVPTIWQKARIR